MHINSLLRFSSPPLSSQIHRIQQDYTLIQALALIRIDSLHKRFFSSRQFHFPSQKKTTVSLVFVQLASGSTILHTLYVCTHKYIHKKCVCVCVCVCVCGGGGGGGQLMATLRSVTDMYTVNTSLKHFWIQTCTL